MTTFQVKDAVVSGEWTPENGSPLAIHHYTLADNGTEKLAIRWAKPETALPEVGSTVEFDVTGTDNRSGRIKVKPAFFGAGNSGGGGQSFKRDPDETRRIQRQHQTEMALTYIGHKITLGEIKAFTFEDVQKLTDAFMRDLDGPVAPSDVPMDQTNLGDPDF